MEEMTVALLFYTRSFPLAHFLMLALLMLGQINVIPVKNAAVIMLLKIKKIIEIQEIMFSRICIVFVISSDRMFVLVLYLSTNRVSLSEISKNDDYQL
jgi:hypothetical protein